MTNEEYTAVRRVCAPLRQPVIVELGARTGEDEDALRRAFREPCKYVMVEADMSNCQAILDHSHASQPGGTYTTINRRLILGAVAGHTGTVTFHGAKSADDARTSGSIRRPTGHLRYFPEITFPDELRTVVPCYTLDEIFRRELLEKIDLLWVDIQGAERDMIAGGAAALARTRYLFIEAEEEELYEGEALKPELIAILPGWTLLEDFGYNLLMRNDNELLTGRL